ncbi:MAG: type I pantothenate kinase [Shewanellaceae bacterium]|nr:type I pantothenate kinase [Shewanellaceae bacterium]
MPNFTALSREQWSWNKKHLSLSLSPHDLSRIQGINEKLSFQEVREIYLPVLTSLMPYHTDKQPFIIGICGSVAVGKTTTARLIKILLERLFFDKKISYLSTDSFLQPLSMLKSKQMLHRKGFPESYQWSDLLNFLAQIKAKKPHVRTPIYSHEQYDILHDQFQCFDQPDILIIEGLNILQQTPNATEHIQDYLDFSIFIDAHPARIKQWYIDRFLYFKQHIFINPSNYFHSYADLSTEAAIRTATEIWDEVNGLNLTQHILPTRAHADIVLSKGADHFVHQIMFRDKP